jgi:hypothetical protein
MTAESERVELQFRIFAASGLANLIGITIPFRNQKQKRKTKSFRSEDLSYIVRETFLAGLRLLG